MKMLGMAVIALAATGVPPAQGGEITGMRITSPAFENGAGMASRYTCQGKGISPPLAFFGAPSEAKSLALIVDDPDAPKRTWVHWLLYNLPPDAAGLAEAVDGLPAGTLEGSNDWKRTGYGSPCPPVGRHRYFFKLYALDVRLPDLGAPDKATLLAAMQGHVIAEAQLIATYQKR